MSDETDNKFLLDSLARQRRRGSRGLGGGTEGDGDMAVQFVRTMGRANRASRNEEGINEKNENEGLYFAPEEAVETVAEGWRRPADSVSGRRVDRYVGRDSCRNERWTG